MNNPFSSEDFDMQDIRGDQYALFSPVRNWLRFEGLGYLALALCVYQALAYSWMQFALWFLLPELAIVAYFFGNARACSYFYNAAHSLVLPALLAIVGVLFSDAIVLQASLIWFANIGLNRAIGSGLRFPLGFRVTHLGLLRNWRRE
jgi:hypothetical protein